MPLNGSVKTEVKCHQLLLSKFPEAVKATPASLECVAACVCVYPHVCGMSCLSRIAAFSWELQEGSVQVIYSS